MQLTTLLAFAAGALAAPASNVCRSANAGASKPFGVINIRSGSPVHFQSWGATNSYIVSGLTNQNATCDHGDTESATFQIRDEELFLYNKNKDVQKVWVDRSGMGELIIPLFLLLLSLSPFRLLA